MTQYTSIIETIRKRAKSAYGLDAASVGVVSSFGSDAVVIKKSREIDWVANTSDIDMEDEVVVPEGLDPKRYFDRNRAIFLDHRYETMYKIGSMRSRSLVDGPDGRKQWRVRAYIYPTELGNAVLTLAEEGGGMPCSIGFAAVDAGKPTKEEAAKYGQSGRVPKSIVRKSDWIELSATAIPMNVSCQGSLSEPSKRSIDTLDNLIVKGKISVSAAIAMGYKDAKRRVQVRIARHTAVALIP